MNMHELIEEEKWTLWQTQQWRSNRHFPDKGHTLNTNKKEGGNLINSQFSWLPAPSDQLKGRTGTGREPINHTSTKHRETPRGKHNLPIHECLDESEREIISYLNE